MADNVITKGLLEEAFRAANGGKDIEVLDFTVSKAASFGDGFMTSMYGVQAEVKEGTDRKVVTVVVKAMPNNPVMQTIVNDGKLFKKELGCYKCIIPALVDFQRERNVEPLMPSVPKFYAGRDDTNNFLVLEDLRPLEFKMANVKEGLDLDHCLLAVKELAKLHALSFGCKNGNEATFLERFGDCLSDVLKNKLFIDKFQAHTLDAFQKALGVVKSYGNNTGLKIRISDAFEKKAKNPYAAALDCLSQPTEPYGVICHGDAWCNNMMFRYGEDGRPVEVKLLDLQVVRYALPTTDIAYFLFMSTTQETRKKHFDNLLKSYHSAFFEVLVHLGKDAPGFTVDVLKDMFQRTAFYGVMSALKGLPGILAEHNVLNEVEKQESLDEIVAVVQDNAVGNDLVNKRIVGVIADAVSMNL